MSMDISAFLDLIETYGADRRRWPAERREQAEALLETDMGARALLEAEMRFEETLDAWQVPEPRDSLRQAILRSAPGQRGGFTVAMPRGWFGAGIGALMAASCAAGVMAGFLLVAPPEPADPNGEAAVWAALSGPSDAAGYDDATESEQS